MSFQRRRVKKASAEPSSAEDSEQQLVDFNALAYAQGIASLARREQSRSQVQAKLERGGLDSAPIENALDRLQQDGYLSDQRFAEARSRNLAGRGKGPRAIQADLTRARVAPDLQKQSLAEHSPAQWLERAKGVLERKYGALPPADRKDWERRARFLIARGFAESIVRQALSATAAEDY